MINLNDPAGKCVQKQSLGGVLQKKKVFLKISPNSQESVCVGAYF